MECGGTNLISKKHYRTDIPLLTIITVVYNGGKTIERTIESVLSQEYKNIEYIIVDGGSKDDTLGIIKKYDEKINYWVSEPDDGIYYAMNKGIKLASGDYICLLNADDWFEPNTCQIIADRIGDTRSAYDVYYGMARVINSIGETVDMHGSTVHILNRSSVAHQTCFISKEIYDEYMYDTKYRSAADYDFICKLKQHGVEFDFIEEVLVNYSLNGMSDSVLGQKETYQIKKKYGFISSFNYFIHEVSLNFSSVKGKLRRK